MIVKELDKLISERKQELREEKKRKPSSRKLYIQNKKKAKKEYKIQRISTQIPERVTKSSSLAQISNHFGVSNEHAKLLRPSVSYFENNKKMVDFVINTVSTTNITPKKVKNLDTLYSFITANTQYKVPYNAISFLEFNNGDLDDLTISKFSLLFYGESVKDFFCKNLNLSKNEFKVFIQGECSSFSNNYIRAKFSKEPRWGLLLENNIKNQIVPTRLYNFYSQSHIDSVEFIKKLLRGGYSQIKIAETLDYLQHIRTYDDFEYKKMLSGGIGRVVHASDIWHDAMKMVSVGKNVIWENKNYSIVMQEKDDGTIKEVIAFEELCSATELATEGRKQSHCVYSYVRRCINGSTSIVSLRKIVVGLTITPMVTIEINNDLKRIVQVRGKANREATNFEKLLVQKFATIKGLKY